MTTKQPGAEFPFAGNLLETLELMKKVWGAGLPQVAGIPTPAAMTQSLPSMMVPTLDIDELDKRIADLRAVEQWLALNASMLRASIQGLEVQRNTIATLKSLSSAMMTAPLAAKPAAAPPTPSAGAASPPAPATPTPAPRRARRQGKTEAKPRNTGEMPMNPAAWWGNLQEQFTRIAAAAAGGPGGPAPAQPREEDKPAARKPPVKRSS
jgi:hypothetical protein